MILMYVIQNKQVEVEVDPFEAHRNLANKIIRDHYFFQTRCSHKATISKLKNYDIQRYVYMYLLFINVYLQMH